MDELLLDYRGINLLSSKFQITKDLIGNEKEEFTPGKRAFLT